MKRRGIQVDYVIIQRWVFKFTSIIESQIKMRKNIGVSWRMDESYIKVKGIRFYSYRAVDKSGNTVDFSFNYKKAENECPVKVLNLPKELSTQ